MELTRRLLCLSNKTLPSNDRPKIKDIATEYLENSTTHGIGNIYKTTRIFPRIFWIIAFVVFLSIFLSGIPKLISNLTANEHITRIHDETQENGIEFPAVTLCNANAVRFQKMDTLLKQFFPEISNWTHETYREKIQDLLLMSVDFNSTLLSWFGEQPEDFFAADTCLFSGERCRYPEDFFMVSSSFRGNCFTFNFNGSLLQRKTGVKYGLTLIMDISQTDYNIYIQDSAVSSVGAFVTMHNSGYTPPSNDEALLVAPNQISRMAIRKKSIQRLKYPYRDNCADGNADFNMKGRNYTVSTCTLLCNIKEMHKYCKVVDTQALLTALYSLGRRYKPATTKDDFKCLKRFESLFKNGKVKCSCPNPCYEEFFTNSISTASWPSEPELKQKIIELRRRNRNVTEKSFKENFLAIQIYYENFNIERTVHIPAYSIDDFFSDLGGSLGLWIGSSFLSLLEIGAMLVEMIRVKINSNFNFKTNANSVTSMT